jgi:ornithine cyclodeaminase
MEGADGVLILSRRDVRAVLDGADDAVCQVIREAYVAHARGDTAVPHSLFLRFPDAPRNRIIALPAYVGGTRPVAGIKWVASFPGNVARGQERASATIVLNSLDDGQPVAVLEGAVISARRTAASAALAAAELTAEAPAEVRAGVSLIGCGVINREVLRMLRLLLPELARVTVYDVDGDRARAFAAGAASDGVAVEVATDAGAALAAHRIVSLATTAAEPHLTTAACRPGSLLLHLSLRDLAPESILAARNVVDDADHVLRAATSLELAEQRAGHREFLAAQIGDLLAGQARLPYDGAAVTVFSPFGLGALDAALAAYVLDAAAARGLGTGIADFAADVDTPVTAS